MMWAKKIWKMLVRYVDGTPVVIRRIIKPSCRWCGLPFSDWFVWSDGVRFCYPCWHNSKCTIVWKEEC